MNIRATIVLILALGMAQLAHGQCSTVEKMDDCISRVTNDYTFLKSYRIEPDDLLNGDIEYSYVFTKDTDYLLALCQDTTNGKKSSMKVDVYDANRQLIVTNVYDKRFMGKIGYKCRATGMYYFRFSFPNQANTCGISVIGFKR